MRTRCRGGTGATARVESRGEREVTGADGVVRDDAGVDVRGGACVTGGTDVRAGGGGSDDGKICERRADREETDGGYAAAAIHANGNGRGRGATDIHARSGAPEPVRVTVMDARVT